MQAKLSGIRFLLISPDTNFLRNKKNSLKNDYNSEVFLSKDFSDAIDILEKENPQIIISYAPNTEEVLNFISSLQEFSYTSLIYFYGDKFLDVKQLWNTEWKIDKNQVHFLTLPVQWQKIFEEIEDKIQNRSTDLANLSQGVKKLQYYLLFRSEKMQRGLEFLPQMASTDYSMLITGESGTGKEMVARAIHSLSKRKDNPFIVVNCGAIPENLVESELFGYEKGAFTGANSTKKGKFELANRGTLFLDEIGDMPLNLQVKLLRILEDGQVFRVGSERGFFVNVRVLAATNVKLQQKIQEKLFREDLFYRLNILQVNIPPLRERKEDIGLLAWHFLQKVLSEINYQAPYPYLTDEAVYEIEKYPWYGNVRELKNFMIKLAVLLPPKTRKIQNKDIKVNLQGFATTSLDSKQNFSLTKEQNTFQISLDKTLAEVKNLYIEKVLQVCDNNKTKASRSLGISLRSLRQKSNNQQ